MSPSRLDFHQWFCVLSGFVMFQFSPVRTATPTALFRYPLPQLLKGLHRVATLMNNSRSVANNTTTPHSPNQKAPEITKWPVITFEARLSKLAVHILTPFRLRSTKCSKNGPQPSSGAEKVMTPCLLPFTSPKFRLSREPVSPGPVPSSGEKEKGAATLEGAMIPFPADSLRLGNLEDVILLSVPIGIQCISLKDQEGYCNYM